MEVGWNLWLKPQVLVPLGSSKYQAMKWPPAGMAMLSGGACLRGHLHLADDDFCTLCILGSRIGPAPPLAATLLI